MTSEITIRLKLCVSLFLAAASFAAAQSSLVPPGTAYSALPEPGSGHDYIQGLSETVDPSTGALTIQLTIPMPRGRGLTLPFSILYNSDAMLVGGIPNGPIMYGDISASAEVGGGGGTEFNQGGWTYTLPEAGYTEVSQVMQSSLLVNSLNPLGLVTCYYNVNWTFRDSTGATKGLGLYTVPWGNSAGDPAPGSPADYLCLGQGASVTQVSGYPGSGPALGETPEILSSSDYGVQATVLSDKSGESPQSLSELQVADRDGNVYSFNGASTAGLASAIEDRNGNIVSIQDLGNGAFTITDTTGQVVMRSSSFGNMSSGDTLSVRGAGSAYHLTWETIGSNAYKVLTGITLPNGQAYTFTYGTTAGTCSYSQPGYLGPLLQTITYPTGATVTYQWTSASDRARSIQVVSDTSPPNIQVVSCTVPSVYTRTVSFDGEHNALEQTFSYPEPAWVATDGNYQNLNNLKWTSEQTVVTTQDLIRNTSYTTTYTYVPGLSGEPVQPGMYAVMSQTPSTWFSVPVESKIVTTNSSSATVKTVAKNWYSAHYLQAELDTVAGGKSSLTTYTWNNTDQLTQKNEYDFGAPVTQTAGSPWTSTATPLRQTVSRYQPFSATKVFPGAQAIYDRPCQTIVYNSGGTKIAETDNYYDGGSTLCAASAGQTTSAVSPGMPSGTYDSANFGPSLTTPRGNATKTVVLLNTGSSSSTTYAYDQSGQKISEIDPCGNSACADMSGSTHTTKYSYNDCYTTLSGGSNVSYTPSGGNTNTLLTQITNPLAQNQAFCYDFSSGQLTSMQDQNKKTTTYIYNDSLERLTQVNYPDNGQTEYSYVDSETPSVTTCQLMSGSRGTSCSSSSVTSPPSGWKVSVATMDGMGHVTTKQTSDPYGVDTVNTVYDGQGRVYTATNPHRASSAPSDGTTTYYYDALGRIVQQNQPDGSTLQWCYNGVVTLFQVANCSSLLGSGTIGNETAGMWVDSTDERSVHRQQATSSLGHLLKVMEPNGASQSPSMETDYAYDMLNNLLSVTQWGGASGSSGARTRSFLYDSYSRLLCASNPENSYAACPSTYSGYVAGTTGYTYDANGNVSTKIDARGIKTTYLYDDLNRALSKSYSDGATPFACYQYDSSSVTNGISRLSNEWTQKASSGSCGASFPPSSGYLSARSISAYDAMGRSLSEKQYTPWSAANAKSYPMTYTYDLAGNLTSSSAGAAPPAMNLTTSPSAPCTSWPSFGTGIFTFIHCYDGAGRLLGVTSNAGSGPASLFTAQGYAAFGGLTSAIYGSNAVTLSRTYDNRLRVTSETDMGNHPATATNGSASVTITGVEQSK